MATTIVLKNSVTTTNAPSSLAQGEVAINVTDKKVWVGNAATTPIQIVNGGPDGVFTSVTDSGLTNTRVTYAGAGGLLKDSANIVTDGSKITTSTGFVGGPWTTATRPASPATGQEGFNTTLGIVEVYNGTAWVAAATIVPTSTVYTSGSGTYTTPTGAKYLIVEMVGGGGGGGGSGSSPNLVPGGAGGTTTFGTALYSCNGGSGGGYGSIAAGGTSSGSGIYGVDGGDGATPTDTQPATYLAGGNGGASAFGGEGGGAWLGNPGGNGKPSTGGGGGGGGSSAVSCHANAGGGAGAYILSRITSPSATYSYAIGAAGTAGAASTNGYVGGAGGSGCIIVTAYF